MARVDGCRRMLASVLSLWTIAALPALATTDPAFVNVAADTGADFVMPPNAYPRAVAVADYDADGWTDIFIAVSGRDPNGHPGSPHVGSPSFLLRNCGGGYFEDVTAAAGLFRANRSSSGASFADYDNDGDLDLYIANRGAVDAPASINELFRNNGDGTFSDVTAVAGVANHGFGYSTFWLDHDHDGDLDLYVQNLSACCNEGNTTPDSLYRNDGIGGFVEVTKENGLITSAALGGDGGAVGDFDNDGFQDILKVAADEDADGEGRRFHVLRNSGRSGFVDQWSESGLGHVDDSRGASFGDYDNDGDLDLFVVGNGLWRNDGGSPTVFTNVTAALGFDFGPYRGRRFGHTWADLNNDGWLDLVAENRWAKLAIFVNLGANDQFAVFENIEPVLDTAADPKVGLGVLDFDNDGDWDVFLAKEGDTFHGGQPQVLYENRLQSSNHYVDVTLTGAPGSPQSANGARIFVESGSTRQMREIKAGENAAGAADYRQHFGLGTATLIDLLTVRWPDGTADVYYRIPVDQHIRITQHDSEWFVIVPRVDPPYAADGHVDGTDARHFLDCLTGPNAHPRDCSCRPADLDSDRDVDLRDFTVLQNAYFGM